LVINLRNPYKEKEKEKLVLPIMAFVYFIRTFFKKKSSMTSYIKKYITALASAKEFIARWSADHVYADQALIVPFPTLAIFDPETNVWSIHIKAWLYLPFEGKKLKSYLPSLRNYLTGKIDGTKNEEKIEESISEDKKLNAAMAIEGNKKQEELTDDDIFEDALGELNRIIYVYF
jgi:hypothetical protein